LTDDTLHSVSETALFPTFSLLQIAKSALRVITVCIESI